MRYLANKEKSRSRKLWEEVFSEDSEAFLDYYYTEKTKDNQILVEEDRGEIVSMLHRNPYRMYLKGAHAMSEYLVAVATKKEYRGQGLMKSLLIRCMQDAYAAQIPFQFLMPAAEEIYLPFGFRFITDKPKHIPVCWQEKGLREHEAGRQDYEDLASFVNLCLADSGGLYVQRTPESFARVHRERSCDGGGMRVVTDDQGILAGYYNYYLEDGKEDVVEAVFRPRYAQEIRKALKSEDNRPHLMARITCLLTFLRCFTIPPQLLKDCPVNEAFSSPAVYLDVADLMIPGNHGHFLWYFRESRSHIISLDVDRRAVLEESGVKRKEAVVVDIADLGSWLFGYRPFDELVKEGLIAGPAESLELLRKVKPLQHIYIREEV